MFSGGLNKLDGWKDLKQVSEAERRHQQDAKVRAEGETLHTRLDQAFQNYQKTPPTVKESAQPKVGEKVGGDLPKEGIGLRARDIKTATNSRSLASHITIDVKTAVAISPSTQSSQIYKTPSSLPANNAKQPPHVTQASHFVTNVKQPQLADLLLRRSNTPPAPPKADDKKQPTIKEGVEIKKEVLESSAGKVQGPIASDAGAQLANATKKREEGDVGKKREDKKSEGGEKAKGKSALVSSRAEGSEGEQKLEAAAGGVAGESSEPLWLADLEPGVEFFNPETKLDDHHALVSKEAALFRRHVLKNSDVSAVLENALALNNNEDLNRALREGLAARTHNIYGMTRG